MEKNIRQINLSERDRAIRMKLAVGLVIVFVSLAVWMGSGIYRQAENGVSSSQWPSTEGYIVSSEITRHANGSSRRLRATRYSPNIYYTYKINGIEYEGRRLTFMNSSGGKSWAEQKVNNYPAGKRVDVYYKPQDLTISVLEPGATMKWLILSSGAILIFCVVFLLIAYVCYRDYQKVKKARFEGGRYYF
ncbi:MAG: DUF3592 domain-containing protein [Candidatus Omnitrophica bacterium]|jgi:hypothetical protein|nr:DUF3592 domain-containing protein [Candidatus Omnitrophota bacterium]